MVHWIGASEKVQDSNSSVGLYLGTKGLAEVAWDLIWQCRAKHRQHGPYPVIQGAG